MRCQLGEKLSFLLLAPLTLESFRAIGANLMFKMNIAAGGFLPEKYKSEVPMQSDFKKFDDNLRMVIDCSLAQGQQIERIFEEGRQSGLLYYGMHSSESAVATCLTVSATKGEHLHFVDGEGCGYTMASIQLKAQIKGEP